MFFSSPKSRPAVERTQLSVTPGPAVLSLRVKLTTARLGKSEAAPLRPPVCLNGAHNSNAACPFPTAQDTELEQWSWLTLRGMPRL